MWLVKAINLNRGRGIKLTDNIVVIQKLIKKFYDGVHKEYYKDQQDEVEQKEDRKESIFSGVANERNNLLMHSFEGVRKKCLFQTVIAYKEKKEEEKAEKVEKEKSDIRQDKNIENEKKKEKYKVEITKDDKYRSSMVIIQKYIEQPLTYFRRKFDVRVWVLINQDMDVFAFKYKFIN